MGQLTRHVLDLAIAQCRVWRDLRLDLAVAVNVSARNLHYTELVDDVATLLGEVVGPGDGARARDHREAS